MANQQRDQSRSQQSQGSHSGQPGDLEGSAGIVDTDRKTPIAIAIDKVH